jgi:tetratricopeptide (TPR) repeat protein
MNLSACMIVKNEAPVLPRALASLAGRADEIVVIDTGSTDGTQAICREAGCVLKEVPWQRSFSAARNAAFALARGRFCLMIDADEEVDAATWPALLAFLAAGRHGLGRVWQVSDTDEGLVREAVTRVCEGGGRYRYEGRVHEQLVPVPAQAPGGLPRVHGDTGLVLRHSGYQKEALARKGTVLRNLELLQLDLADRPGDAYVLYQIGRTLWQERPAEALRHFERALASVPPDAPYLPGMVREMGHTLRRLDRPRDALGLVRHYAARLPGFTDLVFLEGLLYMDLGDARAMIAAFTRCLALGDAEGHSTVDGTGSFLPHHNLGLFYELAGDRARARHHYQAALASNPRFGPAAERLGALDSTEGRLGP